MKYLFLLLLTLYGCGGGGGASGSPESTTSNDPTINIPECKEIFIEQISGSWERTAINDSLIVNDDCSYETSYCGGKGFLLPYQFSANNIGGVDFILKVDSVENSDCTKVGVYKCFYRHEKQQPPVTYQTLDIYCSDNSINSIAYERGEY